LKSLKKPGSGTGYGVPELDRKCGGLPCPMQPALLLLLLLLLLHY
jgi:hypothetical protein